MPSNVSWSGLRVGLIAIIVIVVAVLSILIFARVGALHGDTRTLYVTTADATGVLVGTDVWLSGEKVGLVKAVRFRPVNTDTLQRIAIETEILANRLPLIRRNSYADVRAGGSLIGTPVVYIGGGTAAARPLRDGDTIASRTSGPIAAVGTQVDTLGARLDAIADSSRKVMNLLNSTSTTIGAFRSGGTRVMANARAVTSALADKATRGNGTLGLAYRGGVGERLRRVMAQKDSITTLLSSGRGNLGRFKRDSTLLPTIARVRLEVDSIRALIFNSSSGVARLRSDTTLKNEIARARVQLDSLMRDLKKHPLKYISF